MGLTRTYVVRWHKPPKTRREWLVRWLHRTESSSWWGTDVIEADTAESAASKMLGRIDIEKHTTYNDRRLRVRVFGPLPEEGEEFYVAPSVDIEVVAGQ